MLYLKGLFLSLLSLSRAVHSQCVTDDDCSLNGICSNNGLCLCDPGWTGGDCGQLDLRPTPRNNGYNLTGQGTSSWGAKIIQDPNDRAIFYTFMAEFTHGCGLDYWSPYSRIIQSKSTDGPLGPYHFEREIVGTFAHNPTVIYSEVDSLYLLYHIGCPTAVPDTCQTIDFTCGSGNFLNGESGISMWSSPDLINWAYHGQVLRSNTNGTWDTDTTNPSPFPLWSSQTRTPEMLLAYRGCPYNCGGAELLNLASAPHFTGPYTRLNNAAQPIFSFPNEDPFLWRDWRGNLHLLTHSLLSDAGFGGGPNVGRHAYAQSWQGPWIFNTETVAFNTTAKFTDGSSIDYYRRERPQLYFSDDGEMTPLYLTNGVQEVNSPASYTLIQPIGDGASAYEKFFGV